jgi:hypothetical protein
MLNLNVMLFGESRPSSVKATGQGVARTASANLDGRFINTVLFRVTRASPRTTHVSPLIEQTDAGKPPVRSPLQR